ncbi:hypothetical protein Taro_001894 [Colocasia esculenta]|uniref:CCHC-type domain-containing protein n=1 Tax=Colocasia esculenta TaxID=4460 RepID=A0A843TK83_COLES|nr:hypothetical protein [Colocasia esculenta]
MQDSFKKTSKIANKAKEKCYMAHGSSRGSSRSDDSRGSHMSKTSRNSQESEAQNVSRKSPTPHHAKRYQGVPPPSSQPKGDQRYSKGSQRFQQMQSHYGKLQVNAQPICFKCNRPGHLAKFCWNKNQHCHNHAKPVQCFTCHKIGHISKNC